MKNNLSVIIFLITVLFGHSSLFALEKEKIDELIRKLPDAQDTLRVRILNTLSYELRKSDSAKTRLYANEAYQLSRSLGFPQGEVGAYINLGEYFRIKNNHEKALTFYFNGIDLCLENNLKQDLAKIYIKVGVVYQNISDYEQALVYFNKSLPITKELGDDHATAGIYNNIGIIHFLHGEYADAQADYLASLKIRERLGDKNGIAASYNNIANVFNQQKEYDQALAYYLKGAEIRKEIKDQKGLSSSYGNIGALYYQVGDNAKAMLFYEEAMQINEQLNDQPQIALNYINIGKILVEQGEHTQAVEKFFAAKQLYKKIGDKRGLASTETAIGGMYITRKNYTLAKAHLKEALRISKEINIKEEVQNVYYKLAQTCEGIGDYKSANEYYKLYVSTKDSLFNETSTKMVAELETKYRTGEKQREIELLKKEKEIQAAVLGKNEIIIYSSFAVIVLVLILAFIVYKNNRNKNKINATLLVQNKKIFAQKEEKEVLLKEVHHRVKNNLQVINSLLNIQSAYIDDDRVSALFVDCQNRIRSMALIHEQLYSSTDLHKVDLKAYIESLTRDILRSYNLNYEVSLELDLKVQSFGVNTLIPVGLILNELFSNSLKHAFEDGIEGGKITISLKNLTQNSYELIVGDNGKGIKGDSWNSENSLGLELVETFVKQLDGTIEKLPIQGTVFRIIFKDISPSAATSTLKGEQLHQEEHHDKPIQKGS